MKYQVEVSSRNRLYDGFFHVDVFELRHELFEGGWSNTVRRELFERGQAVAVLPYDPVADAVVLVEQFRIGALAAGERPWLFEFVAGMVEVGESPEAVAHREAAEEAGCTLGRLMPIAEYFSTPGGMSEKIILFCGEVDSRSVKRNAGVAEESEDILVHVLGYDDAVTALADGRINSATPIVAMQWLMLNRERVRDEWRRSGSAP
ncbi:MAG: NUDIX domain-containing protein [Pseudomonadota bacterium]